MNLSVVFINLKERKLIVQIFRRGVISTYLKGSWAHYVCMNNRAFWAVKTITTHEPHI